MDGRERFFVDREEAGGKISEEFIKRGFSLSKPIVLGIPRGGVPVGYNLAKDIKAEFDTVVVRKLPIPQNPEAGFGAVTLDKTVLLNDKLLSQIFLSETEKIRIIDLVYEEVLRRDRIYRGDKSFPDLKNRSVIITDDGLASGYTMLSAVEFSRKKEPEEIIAVSPVAHRSSYKLIKKKVDSMLVLHISDFPYFAVASFYERFPDMSDEEVISYLEKGKDK
jgi:putative phosphoribosyl transferase